MALHIENILTASSIFHGVVNVQLILAGNFLFAIPIESVFFPFPYGQTEKENHSHLKKCFISPLLVAYKKTVVFCDWEVLRNKLPRAHLYSASLPREAGAISDLLSMSRILSYSDNKDIWCQNEIRYDQLYD